MGFWPTPLPPTFKNAHFCWKFKFLYTQRKKDLQSIVKALIGIVVANYNTVDPDSSLTKVHEDMNLLVKYKIRDESNIIIDTVTSMNKVHEGMNSLVKYMIWGEYNNTIDTENFTNKVHEGMNSLVKYMIRGECNITIDTDNFMN